MICRKVLRFPDRTFFWFICEKISSSVLKMFIFIVQISAQMHNFITSIYSSAMFRDVKHYSSFNLKRKIHWGFTTSWKSWWGVRQDSISCKSRFICFIEAWQQQKYLLPLKTQKVKACLSMQKSSNKKSCYAFNWQETKLNIKRYFK